MFDLSLAHWLVLASACIQIAGAAAYIRDTLAGTTKPNLVTWSMWSAAPLIGTSAAIAAQADLWATVRIFLAGFLPLLVFLTALFNPQSYWKLSRFDLLCGLFSLLALVVWVAIDSPRLAILLSATGDTLAAIPTIRKAWRYPETETAVTYVASFLSVALVLPSIPTWNIENASFQLYLLATNAVLLVAIYRRRLGL